MLSDGLQEQLVLFWQMDLDFRTKLHIHDRLHFDNEPHCLASKISPHKLEVRGPDLVLTNHHLVEAAGRVAHVSQLWLSGSRH